MARKPRLHVPGAFYHVMLRGNDRQAIFSDDSDWRRMTEFIADGVARFDHRLHAYCLMGNHVHLAIEVGTTTLSRIIQNLAFRYAQYYNRRTRRVGHLFQGRFRALMVDRNAYLLELVRYIHCNPVRSGLVTSAEAWAWSGHRAYLGRVSTPWLTTGLVLGSLSDGDLRTARRRYAGFVREGLGESYREDLHRGSQAVQEVAGCHETVPARHAESRPAGDLKPALGVVIREVCLELALSEADLKVRSRRSATARAVVGWLVQATGATTLTEVATHFGRDLATISHQVAALRRRLHTDSDLTASVGALCSRLGG